MLFSITILSQNRGDGILINYNQNKIYAIINNSSNIDTSNVNYKEGLSDFIFHSNKLADNIQYPLEIFSAEKIKIADITLDLNNVAFCYVFINKETESLKVLEGIDTWRSLLDQVIKFYK